MQYRFKDVVPLLIVLLASIWLVLCNSHFPEEDAFILFRYSENLANYGVITYNPGDTIPVEGATDFLWMVLLAGLYKLGISTYFAARLVSLVSLWGLGWMLYQLLPKDKKAPNTIAAILVIILFQWPVIAVLTGFSTYFYCFWLTLAAVSFVQDRFRHMIMAGLIACLTRPDAVMFMTPLVLFTLIARPKLLRDKNNLITLAASAAIGVGYFLWRWHYFGLPLPLPFYVKADIPHVLGFLSIDSITQGMILIQICSPVIGYAVYLAWKKYFTVPGWKIAALTVSFIMVPFIFFLTMDLAQNIYFRYFFPIMMTLLLFALLRVPAANARMFYLVMAAWVAFQLPQDMHGYQLSSTPTPQIGIAHDIAALSYKGKVATGEAGILPYYTGWNAFDIYGLDTPSVALGNLKTGDIKHFAPDIIYAYQATHFKDTSIPPSRYDNMIQVILADTDNSYDIYQLNGVYYYFIAKNSPMRKPLADILKAHGAKLITLE